MLSIFKRKSKEKTFRQRVDDFWAWYAGVASRFLNTIDDKRAPELAEEVSTFVNQLFPGFAWVFGPGENGGHSFTLSGEGDLHRQLLAIFWLSRAPKIAGWTFFASRQPARSLEGHRLQIGDRDFNPLEFWITPHLNHDGEKVDLAVWHPLFQELDDHARWTVLFLFLDEALGEIGTQNWIGQIELHDRDLSRAIPLQELPALIAKYEVETGWKKSGPGELWSSYSLPEPDDSFSRSDTIAGTTCNMTLISEYLEAEGELDDPLAGSGAAYAFVAVPAAHFPRGEEVDARTKIEDALEAAFGTGETGRLLGGAMGHSSAYIDLLLFDGDESIAVVRRVLAEQKVPKGTRIEFFAHELRGRRVVL